MLYRGYIPSVVNNSLMIGGQFAVAGEAIKSLKKMFGKKPKEESVPALFLGTFFGGYISGFWCGPIELAMIQQQRFGMPLGACLRKIVSEYGIFNGIFRGTFNTSAREGNWLIHYIFYLSCYYIIFENMFGYYFNLSDESKFFDKIIKYLLIISLELQK